MCKCLPLWFTASYTSFFTLNTEYVCINITKLFQALGHTSFLIFPFLPPYTERCDSNKPWRLLPTRTVPALSASPIKSRLLNFYRLTTAWLPLPAEIIPITFLCDSFSSNSTKMLKIKLNSQQIKYQQAYCNRHGALKKSKAWNYSCFRNTSLATEVSSNSKVHPSIDAFLSLYFNRHYEVTSPNSNLDQIKTLTSK